MALDAATLALTAAELGRIVTDAKIAKIFEPTRDEVVLERKFDVARTGASVFVHSIKNQLLANRVLHKRIRAELQKEEPEDSTSAAADGDSAPADQSMKPQINADAGEQDDSSTQVSQPSVQPESSSSAGESAEASALPEQQQSSGDFSLTLPVSGAAITPFSGDMLVKNETLGDWRTHNGIDISAATGTAVTAASNGIVTSVHSDPMWGNVVEVTSGEVVMTYAGLGDDIAVSVDQQVTAGETLGSVGQIPCELSLEPHLHFDVQVNGDYVDPASLVE